ncbi:MAG TPA: SRPBCC family protein [bacterium]
MKVLKIIGLVVGGLVALFLIVAAVLPASYRIQRSIEINQPAEVIYELVVNLPNWPRWDPFTQNDPSMKSTFNGEAGTIGSKWEWEGKDGTGRMTIEEVVANQSIRSKLEFLTPQAMVAADNWSLTSTANGTKVAWVVTGDLDYPVGRVFGLFMEGMLGPTFEQGLANLKKVSEQQVEPAVTTLSDSSSK